MTNADNMFYSLGYEKFEIEPFITYKKVYDTHNARIIFNKEKQLIDLSLDFEHNIETNNIGCCLNAEKIKAINEKCKELGWLDNDEQHIPRID